MKCRATSTYLIAVFERMAETVWYKDLPGFLQGRRKLRFFPTATMTVHAQLNAIMRLCLYYSIIMIVLTRKVHHAFVTVAAGLITALVSEVAYGGRSDAFVSGPVTLDCVDPTVDNPHMNFNVFDPPDRARACPPWRAKRATEVAMGAPMQDTPFQNSFNRFYTMPVTTAQSDQKGFAEWLYGTMPAKSGGSAGTGFPSKDRAPPVTGDTKKRQAPKDRSG